MASKDIIKDRKGIHVKDDVKKWWQSFKEPHAMRAYYATRR